MTPTDQNPSVRRGDTPLAFGIMFFAVALLCLLLGWAWGVKQDTTYLHIPESGGWLIATAVLAVIGIALLLWSRMAKRG